MHERPIGDLVEVLLQIGAEVEYVEREGYPPLRIRGKKMRGGFDVTISAETSSQFVSALMLGGATLPDGITLRIASLASGAVHRHHRRHPDDVRRARGPRAGNVDQRPRGDTWSVDEYRVEGDYSSASYWFAAAAATRGTMRVRGLAVPTAQGDAGFLDILAAMGCTVAVERRRDHRHRPGDAARRHVRLQRHARHRPDARRDRAAGVRRRSRS